MIYKTHLLREEVDYINMFDELNTGISGSIGDYFKSLGDSPWNVITFIVDITIVIVLIYYFIKFAKETRVWQLIKGIVFLIIITFLSGLLKLKILNYLLTSVMTYGVMALLIIFQPELRRGLEKLGTTNTFSKWFGMEKNLQDQTKENIYRVVIAAEEMSKTKTGALIVFERDVKLQDIIETGIAMDSQISPQVLVNIFVPNTPLHDGAVIIRNNKIAAAACILPLADDKDIAKNLGTRHRSAIGISKESDAIAVVVSEETGKISIAKDGTLIADVNEDSLKRILKKQLISPITKSNKNTFKDLKKKFIERKEKSKNEEHKNNN